MLPSPSATGRHALACSSPVHRTTHARRAGKRFGYVRKLPSGKYQASYPGPDGKRYTAPTTFTHKADAQAWITTERRLIKYSTWTSPAARAEIVKSTARAIAEREATEALAAEQLTRTPTVSQ